MLKDRLCWTELSSTAVSASFHSKHPSLCVTRGTRRARRGAPPTGGATSAAGPSAGAAPWSALWSPSACGAPSAATLGLPATTCTRTVGTESALPRLLLLLLWLHGRPPGPLHRGARVAVRRRGPGREQFRHPPRRRRAHRRCRPWHRSRSATQSLHSCYMGPTLSNASSSSHSHRWAFTRKARSKYRAPIMRGPLPTTSSSSSCPNNDAKIVSFQTT